ncbi:MAG: hypothetical protein A2636_04990 [Elusimicrobia bacterium RIFCSPHIGHO2_01_FULL_64_10]|nr:MAG: hypothetical protein A2636_04990 [Elusimicrobia bacterium RIFCSPHIGHO2_01_FULL_64_10]
MLGRAAGAGDFQKLLEKIASRFSKDLKAAGKGGSPEPGIVGIQTRGVFVGRRIADILKKKHGTPSLVGSLDITLYRDDVGEIGKQPLVKETDIPFEVEGRSILLVDDVLYTGRTIRAALDALLELGRPKLIRLAVVADRAGRELPIQADYRGMTIKVGPGEEVQLKAREVDGEDGVWVIRK